MNLQLNYRRAAPAAFKGTWAKVYNATVEALMERYAKRGPQYQMLAELAASLYTQVKRMEATGAIQGLETLDSLIDEQLEMGLDDKVAQARAQAALANAGAAVRVYIEAIEALRRLIEQAQKYSEARKQEIIVSEVNSAVVETLRIVETNVDTQTFNRIISAVRNALERNAA